MSKNAMGYDIIGDIHGHAESLVSLLGELGYEQKDGVYRHADRKAIFLGDFIDGGPRQREVIEIAKSMVQGGAGLAVMGNHEFNAIAYHTPASNGGYLRPHSDGNKKQHRAFLSAYPDDEERNEVIEWFKSLPMWLDLDGLRAVHACWDIQLINKLEREYPQAPFLSDALLHAASTKGAWQYDAVEDLLKGKEIPLPDGKLFSDKHDIQRPNIRVKWWFNAKSYKDAYLGSSKATHIPDDSLTHDYAIEYHNKEKPVFLGHYWLDGEPARLAENIVCLDYSVAGAGGMLVAYRWDGEQVLQDEKFIAVDRVEV